MLIDGERLPSLVIQYRMGVQAERASKTVAADESFFEYFRGAGEAPSGYSVAQQREGQPPRHQRVGKRIRR